VLEVLRPWDDLLVGELAYGLEDGDLLLGKTRCTSETGHGNLQRVNEGSAS
jgi:hypothetical protein